MTPEDIKNVTFEKAVRGYRTEDVDDFLQKVAQQIEDLEHELDQATAAKEATEGKLYILAQKVEEYRGQEDTLKTALINAQRMGETVVHEAKQKAETMLRDATGKAELLRQQAEEETAAEKRTLERMRSEVTKFRSTILNLYKQHIESLSVLDEPIERVSEFMQANGFGEEIETFDSYEGTDSELDEAFEDFDIEEPELETEHDQKAVPPVGNLFEGVPIDHE